MAAVTSDDLSAILKEVYPSRRVESLALGKRPLLNWLSKKEVMGGSGYAVPVWYENPQSVGHTLSTIITNQENSRQVRFFIDDDSFVSTYGVVAITGKALLGTRSDMFSFLRGKDMQIKGMLQQLGKVLHTELYRSGSGSLGVISSFSEGGGETILTLTNPSDVNNFGVGQVLVANNTDDSTTLLDSGAGYKVARRNLSAGTVTVTGTANATSGWNATHYLFTQGDPDQGMKGLAAWCPLAAPSATSFFTVDRTKDVTRLAGHRVDNAGRTIMENATELATLIGEAEGNPDAIFLNPRAGNVLAEQIGAKVERMDGRKAEVEFDGFRLHHFITGPIDVIFDWACPVNRGYMLQRDTWEIIHMGELAHLVTDDGRPALRGSTTDDIQIRGRAFSQLACFWPGGNGVFSVQV